MRYLFSTLLLFSAFMAKSQDVIFTDRPNVTDAVAVLNQGTFQIEAGYSITDGSAGLYEITSKTTPNLSLKYGLTDRIELRVLTNYRIQERPGFEDINGLDPITISPKFALLEQDGIIPKTTLTLAFTFPNTGKNEFQVIDFNYSFRGLFEYQIQSITWTNSLGMDFIDNDENVLAYTTVLGTPITEKLGVFVELYGYENDGNSSQNLDAGLTYLVNNDLQIDFIYGFDLNSDFDFYNLGFGLAYKFN